MGNTRLRHRPYRPVTPTSEASRDGTRVHQRLLGDASIKLTVDLYGK
jgi:hypothetical protein